MQKLDSQGQVLWTNIQFSNSNPGNAVSAAVPLAGNGFLLGGGFTLNGLVGRSFSVARTDTSGNLLSAKTYERSVQDNLVDMQPTATGNIIAVGTTSNPIGPRHLKLLLLNQNGDSLLGNNLVVRCATCFESMTAGVGDVLPLSDGGFLINASVDTTVGTTGTYRGMLVKVNANLQLVWHYVHRTSAFPIEYYTFTSLKELADRTILALGYKRGPNFNSSFQIYHFSPQGHLLSIYPFQSNICSEVWGITLDALNNNTFMIGGRCGNAGSYGMYIATVKLPSLPPVLPPFTISATNPELTAETSLGQSYPNPTAAGAIIPYSLPKSYRKASISIREIATGREVRSYALKKGSSSLKADISSLSNGLYLYTLIVDDKPIATRKLAVMR